MAPPKTPGAPRGTIRGASSQDVVTFTIRARPMPRPILDFILQNHTTIQRLHSNQASTDTTGDAIGDGQAPDDNADVRIHGDIDREPSVPVERFWDALQEVCQAAGEEWKGFTDKIWAFGPRNSGGCVLIDARGGSSCHSSVFPL